MSVWCRNVGDFVMSRILKYLKPQICLITFARVALRYDPLPLDFQTMVAHQSYKNACLFCEIGKCIASTYILKTTS